jgi:putative endopeptidase
MNILRHWIVYTAMRILVLSALLSGLPVSLFAQPITQLPYSPSLDMRSMDQSVSACTDFYRYSCGNWNKNNPMPADQSSWNVYSKLAFDNERYLWGILEEAGKPSPTRTAAQQKIGDLYHACMDEASIERAGARPMQPALDAIAQLRDVRDVSHFLNMQHDQGTGTAILWGIDSNQDFADAQSVITFATRGALGLPDRDYYTKTDAKSVEIRDRYVQHMEQMFTMIGDSADQAKRHAAQVMSIETDLAKSMLTRVELRDPHKQFHKMTRAEFKAVTPALDWDAYLKTINLGSANVINVTEPAYYRLLPGSAEAADFAQH